MELLKNKSFKRIFSFMMMMTLALSFLCSSQFTTEVKAAGYVTIQFIDNTPQKWIGNDSAVMELVDNTYGHVSYNMTKSGTYTWSVTIPETAKNITFNRYNSTKTTKWNSFSAGGRNGLCCYSAKGHEYGEWIQGPVSGFKTGDVIYLDTSAFTAWEKDGATMYTNFTTASKRENNGRDIPIYSSDKNLYQPRYPWNYGTHLYKYVVTSSDAGKNVLRFWRGNGSTLWNCSITLTYNQYQSGYNCIKVTGWDESGYLYRR